MMSSFVAREVVDSRLPGGHPAIYPSVYSACFATTQTGDDTVVEHAV
jgi:hypothetical protein